MRRKIRLRRKNKTGLFCAMVAMGMVYASVAVMISLDVPYKTLVDNLIASAKLAL